MARACLEALNQLENPEGRQYLYDGPGYTDPLRQPLRLAGHELKHRIVMAPMTRFRASDSGVINATAAEYYSQRATLGGLLISEGLVPDKRGRGFPNSPGIWTKEQVEAWKPVTSAAKAKGGIFFAQLW